MPDPTSPVSGEPVDPWANHPIEPLTPPPDTTATPMPSSETVALPEPATVIMTPAAPLGSVPEGPERPRRPWPLAVTILCLLLVAAATGAVIGWLIPNDLPASPQDTPAPSVGQTPQATPPFSEGSCQKTSGWSNAQKAAWLKLAAGDQTEQDGIIRYKQLPAPQRLCEGLTLSVDYWQTSVIDYGEAFGGNDYRKRLRYASTPIGHDEVVLNGWHDGTVQNSAIWDRPGALPCTGKAITLTLESPGNFEFSDTRMNPATALSYTAFATSTFVAQKVDGPLQQVGCAP
jgi:hypothetical protein